MQVYDILNILSARPQEDELAQAPHHLYGHIEPGADYSTGYWIKDVQKILKDVRARGKLPIFVGGTGLYFQALNGGLSPIPDIPTDIRNKWRDKLETEGIEPLHLELKSLDPKMAAKLKPADRQRITRALEVFETTGQSISHFQARMSDPIINPKQAKKIILMPERAILHKRIAARFGKMMELGALNEVKALMQANVDPHHTSMKAIGVRELSAHLSGQIGINAAIERAIIATRQYAKRQSTWFRNQLDESWEHLEKV